VGIIPREEHQLRTLEIKVLMIIFGPKREEVTREVAKIT
jgi:hypothetical protein